MIHLKSKREIERMREGGTLLNRVLSELREAVRSGMSTLELDEIAENSIRRAGATPAFKGYRGFPATLCVSVNEEVVHGIPSRRKLKEGDLVSLDLGLKYEGYFVDAARSVIVGKGSEEAVKLVAVAHEAFDAGIEAVSRPGKRIGDLSAAIQSVVEGHHFGVVREYVGHGIGREVHEEPQVPNFGKPGHGPKVEPGLVIAVEPMVTAGHFAVEVLQDHWTVVTKDGGLASHYEDTVAFTEEGPMNLTDGSRERS